MIKKNYLFVLALLGFISFADELANKSASSVELANQSKNKDGTFDSCSSANLTDVFTNICWDSVFPIKVAGVSVGSGEVDAPQLATKKSICSCQVGQFRVYGITQGMWLPVRIVEVVRKKGCSVLLGEELGKFMTLDFSEADKYSSVIFEDEPKEKFNLLGSINTLVNTTSSTTFRHFNSFKFPLDKIPNMALPRCFYMSQSMSSEADISALDGGWSTVNTQTGLGRLLTFGLWQEIPALFSSEDFAKNVISASATGASCLAATTGKAVMADDVQYWLSGCLGLNSPPNGMVSESSIGEAGVSQLIVNRHILRSARKTMGFSAHTTVGDGALCSPIPAIFPRKSEFKSTMVFPYSESDSAPNIPVEPDAQITAQQAQGYVKNLSFQSKCSHRLGASPFSWALNRNDNPIKDNDEDQVYVVWRWVDCCKLGGVL